MARTKKTEGKPKDPKTVKRGCLSCTSAEKAIGQEPCKSCVDWSNWVDAYPHSNWK